MAIGPVLTRFNADVAQCDVLFASAHHLDANGALVFSEATRSQITQAAFLNLFIAWESFLEDALANFMVGHPTLNATKPVKYVSPRTVADAKALVIANSRYFDYANIGFVRNLAGLYFRQGYPFEPHLSASTTDISDMRTMRNATAHISSSTQKALEALAQRIFNVPKPGISVYTMLTTTVPGPSGDVVFTVYRDKLLAAAQLIATG